MENALKIFASMSFWSAIFTTIVLIALGFLFRKKNIIGAEGKHVLTAYILKLAIPALAFCGFMQDFDVNQFKESIQVFLFTFVTYIILLVIMKLVFIKLEKNKANVSQCVSVFGQVTMFSLPIIIAIYGEESIIACNLSVVAFRLFLYTYVYFTIMGIKIEKHNIAHSAKQILLNPIMILTFLGILIWVFQDVMPQVNISGVSYGFLRIDKTLPWLYQPIYAVYKTTIPLSMFLIGIILGSSNIKNAFKSKLAWLLAFFKSFGVSMIALILVVSCQAIGIVNLGRVGIATIVLCFAAPVSVVVSTYSASADNNAYLVSDTCFLSTILSIALLPLLALIVELVLLLPIF
ncbi:MAG: AEC family transporter [Bacilli bacterium]